MVAINNVMQVLEGFAPVAISNEYCKKYRAYDNSGIIFNWDRPIHGVLFSLDLSVNAIQAAKKAGCNCIVTHHPAIFSPISAINAQSLTDQALLLAAKEQIAVISMHLNFDLANGGIDECLMHALGGSVAQATYEQVTLGSATYAYGRVFCIEESNYAKLQANICANLNTHRIVFYGKNPTVGKIASFCGAGASEDSVIFAKNQGADLLVSSDFKHHVLSLAVTNGLNVAVLPHYTAEVFGFHQIYTQISQNLHALGIVTSFFTDEDLL